MDTLSKYQNRPVQVNMGKAKGVILGLIVLIIIGVLVGSAVSIVDAGFRGVLLHSVSYTHLTLPTICSV